MHRCRFSVFGVLAGLILSLNLFSGLAPSAKVSEAQASLRQIQGLRRQMESRASWRSGKPTPRPRAPSSASA